MAVSFAVIGPGRVGSALARHWHEAGLRCEGFFGRDASRVEAALKFVGAGVPLRQPEDLLRAAAVVVTVSDPAVEGVVADLVARGAVRSCALWLHASGVHGLGVLAPVEAAGGRIGALHPACPFPDAEGGYAALPGRSALIEGDTAARPLLEKLARSAGLRPIYATAVDRGLYHAACALAANGTTGLLGVCTGLFARAANLPPDHAAALAGDLAAAAARLAGERGPVAALTGPVRRGDAEVVMRHRRALHDAAPQAATTRDAEAVYRQLMTLALVLARQAGLDEPAARAVAEALAAELDG